MTMLFLLLSFFPVLAPTPVEGVRHTKGCNVFGVPCAPTANPKTVAVKQ